MLIRTANLNDAASICQIYNYYIEHTVITFEEDAVSVESYRNRLARILQKYPFLVCEEAGEITGFAYANTWQSRSAYRYTAETTIYLEKNSLGKGTGTALYSALIEKLRESDLHSLIAGIALPNQASVILNEKLGFKKVAHYNQVGQKFNTWIDVGYWQLTL